MLSSILMDSSPSFLGVILIPSRLNKLKRSYFPSRYSSFALYSNFFASWEFAEKLKFHSSPPPAVSPPISAFLSTAFSYPGVWAKSQSKVSYRLAVGVDILIGPPVWVAKLPVKSNALFEGTGSCGGGTLKSTGGSFSSSNSTVCSLHFGTSSV